MSVTEQCALLGLSRSSYYHQPNEPDEKTLSLMHYIDEEYTRHPFLGTRRMVVYLNELGFEVNRKRIQRLYRKMGIEAIYQKPKTSVGDSSHKIYPYLLKNRVISSPNEVWSTDITYIRMRRGFMYLMAVIDWYSRFVLGWALSNTLTSDFCVTLLEQVLSQKRCSIFNTDQGCQFTSHEFTNVLLSHDIQISMDGKGRAIDNIFIERLWRTVKYECIYLHDFRDVNELKRTLGSYFDYYNNKRNHQSLNYQTPAKVYGCLSDKAT